MQDNPHPKSLYPHAQPDVSPSLAPVKYFNATMDSTSMEVANGRFNLARQWPKRSMNGPKRMDEGYLHLTSSLEFPMEAY
jgi:hypothetical protein